MGSVFAEESRWYENPISHEEAYITDISEHEDEVEMEDPPRVLADKSVPWPLKHDKDRYPQLPSVDGKSLPEVKDIVRSFVTLSYRMVSYLSRICKILINTCARSCC
jgi:hypothetical protein